MFPLDIFNQEEVNIMKIFIVTFLFSTLAVAAKYDYKKYWQDSGLISVEKTSAFKLLIKTSPVLKSVPVASLTFTQNNKDSKDYVLSLFKKSVGETCKWKQSTSDGLEIHECVSLANGSFFRVAYHAKTNEFSMGSIALRYILPTYVEMHVKQVEGLTNIKSAGHTKKTALLMQALFQKTFAGELSPNISGYLNQAGSAFFAEPVAAVNRASDTVSDTFSSGRVAKLSAISGATFGLTSTISSMGTHFVVTGSYSMLRTLFYEARGHYTPEEKKARLERFDQAMQSFKNADASLNSLSSKLAIASAELMLSNGVTAEEYLARIDLEIEQVKNAKTEAVAQCTECSEQEKTLKLKQLNDLKKSISNLDIKKTPMQVCENVENLYKEWINAEYTLLNSRRQIMRDLALFNGSIIDGIPANLDFQEVRKQSRACVDNAAKKLNKLKTELNGVTCDISDLSNGKCQRFFAYKDMVESCQKFEEQMLSDKDEVDLEVSIGNVSKLLAQFSKDLAELTCDTQAKGCEKGQLNLIRQQMKAAFVETAKQCPKYYFAKRTTDKTKALVKDDSISLMSLLSKALPDAQTTQKATAEEIIDWNYK